MLELLQPWNPDGLPHSTPASARPTMLSIQGISSDGDVVMETASRRMAWLRIWLSSAFSSKQFVYYGYRLPDHYRRDLF